MEKMFFKYWGKAKRNPNQEGYDYHLLAYHCLDVAAVGFKLLDPGSALCQRLAKKLGVEPGWLQSWFTFCLCLHDLGKFARAFQNLAPNLSENLVDYDARCAYQVRHDALGQGFWTKIILPRIKDVISSEDNKEIAGWLEIVLGHHGQPVDKGKARSAIKSHCLAEDEQAVEQFVRLIIDGWMPDLGPFKCIDKKHFQQSSWQLAGIAVLADWLGSDQTIFKYCSTPMALQQYWTQRALPSATQAVSTAAFKAHPVSPFQTIL